VFVTIILAVAAAAATAIATARRQKNQDAWQPALGAAAGAAVLAWLATYASVRYQTSDREYWTGYVTAVEYREPWTEFKTVVETDAKGNVSTRVVTVHHPAEWHADDTNGERTEISETQYRDICRRFGKPPASGTLLGAFTGRVHRHAHDGRPETAYVWTTVHTFKNPTLVGGNLFAHRDFSTKEAAALQLPAWADCQWTPALGGPPGFADALARLNADLGKACKVRVHFVWAPPAAAPDWGQALEAYWKGGKKNELTVVVGEADGRVAWCHAFGWSRSDAVKAAVRDAVAGQAAFDGPAALAAVRAAVPDQWVPADFKEYDHIAVRVPVWLSLLVVLIALAAGAAVGSRWQ